MKIAGREQLKAGLAWCVDSTIIQVPFQYNV